MVGVNADSSLAPEPSYGSIFTRLSKNEQFTA